MKVGWLYKCKAEDFTKNGKKTGKNDKTVYGASVVAVYY